MGRRSDADPERGGKEAKGPGRYVLLAHALTAILHANDEAEAVDAVGDVIVDHGVFTLSWVAMIDDGELKPVMVSGPATGLVERHPLPVDDGPIARARAGEDIVVVPDVAEEPGLERLAGAGSGGVGSFAALPIRLGGEVAGVLGVASRRIDDFPDKTCTVLRWMAAELGNALTAMAEATPGAGSSSDHAFQADLLASVGDAIVASDTDGLVTYMNTAALALGPWTVEEVVGRSVLDLLPFTDMETVLPEIQAALGDRVPWSSELEYHLPGERTVLMQVTNTPIVRDGKVVGMIGAAADISHRVQTAARMEARSRMQDEVVRLGQLAIVEASANRLADAVVAAVGTTLDLDGAMLVQATPGEGSVVRAGWGADVPPPGSPVYDEEQLDVEALGLAVGSPVVIEDFGSDPRFAQIDSEAPPYRSGAVVIVGGPEVMYGSLCALSLESRSFDRDEIGFLESMANVLAASIEQSAARADLEHLSLNDPVTSLPNRVLLRDRLEHAIALGVRGNRSVGVLMVDLDQFKEVNDVYGHGAGDQLLVRVAERLRETIGPDDTLARMGGDEFAVLHVSDDHLDEFTDLAERLGAALAPPMSLDGVELYVTASIGISVRPAPETSADQLLREADAAVFRAKDAGRDRHEHYDEGLRQQAWRRLDTASALRRALERDELLVLWQAELPIQDAPISGGREVWAEALVRWQHPARGLISPGNFIQLAEETGLIVPVGELVFRDACEQLASWRHSDTIHPTRISVNLSPRQLAHEGLVTTIAETLAATDVAASEIVLEITESAVMTEPESAIRRLNELRELGVDLAMDDFGTGHSSLGHLRRLPVSILKIDQTFIRGLTTHRADWAIVRGIVELAHGLDLTVVAEGIETAEQRDQLVALQCDRAQGYLWSSPVPAPDLDSVLQAWASGH